MHTTLIPTLTLSLLLTGSLLTPAVASADHRGREVRPIGPMTERPAQVRRAVNTRRVEKHVTKSSTIKVSHREERRDHRGEHHDHRRHDNRSNNHRRDNHRGFAPYYRSHYNYNYNYNRHNHRGGHRDDNRHQRDHLGHWSIIFDWR